MLLFMVAVTTLQARRLEGREPAVAAVGTGLLGAAWILPGLWARGVNPVPPCLFHTLTGQPCPFCGGTRSFAAMAHGNVVAAAHVFPIGPVLFAGVILAVAYALWSMVSGRRLEVAMDPTLRKTLVVLGVTILLANWASKLFILGY
jgi:hypothetical protein